MVYKLFWVFLRNQEQKQRRKSKEKGFKYEMKRRRRGKADLKICLELFQFVLQSLESLKRGLAAIPLLTNHAPISGTLQNRGSHTPSTKRNQIQKSRFNSQTSGSSGEFPGRGNRVYPLTNNGLVLWFLIRALFIANQWWRREGAGGEITENPLQPLGFQLNGHSSKSPSEKEKILHNFWEVQKGSKKGTAGSSSKNNGGP